MKNKHVDVVKSHFIFNSKLACALLLTITAAQANDSTGYVGTGGVEYIKNKNISMHSEDLYISKEQIRVNYEFKNLSNKDITETILFPMPAVPSFIDSDYADTNATYDDFQVLVNGKPIIPQLHVRTFMRPIIIKDGDKTFADTSVDTTEIFKACGINQAEMMTPWTYQFDTEVINQQLLNCSNKKLDQFVADKDDPSYISWDSQIIYSWQQTFKANALTTVKHTYTPLVGGSVHLGAEEFNYFCVDEYTARGFHDSGARPYEALSYILTTGANWAKPIKDFKLTVERDPDELMSFCWKGKGKVKKIGATTFEIKESNFVPTHDFDVAFIMK
ncbi:DUF4424 family protein [Psychrobacter aquaticus]|uniref:DUF4424 domain-containing protein n=1 Tax=Psychrobacter aquaticus CMS 56 TaxID=1354303 RepID=U4T3I9_9GAMM|nr:DUF4424 family protein [Psychrobacter aquaticus]ERL55350.1 hypothetical protein M917_1790 [Psychrobacter aquaticus CMS 56]